MRCLRAVQSFQVESFQVAGFLTVLALQSSLKSMPAWMLASAPE